MFTQIDRWVAEKVGSYAGAFALLVLLTIGYCFSFLATGNVIFPHHNGPEVGVAAHCTKLENRKFTDYSRQVIPEAHLHLQGNRARWLATWNPHVEMGRPAFQLGSNGRSYLISNVLSWMTCDAIRFYSLNVAVTIFLINTFLFLFLAEHKLHPLACVVGATGLGLGYFVSYWITFAIFLAGICWCSGCLWLVTVLVRRPSWTGAFGLSFAVYSMLMTAYPQQVIQQGYLISGYVVWLLIRERATWKKAASAVGWLAGATAVGALMSAPNYLDLWVTAQSSSRLHGVSPEFFLAVLPKIHTWGDLWIYSATLIDPFLRGNPAAPSCSLPTDGIGVTGILACLFVACAWDGLWKRVALWLAFVAIGILGNLWPDAYLFAVKYLGFSLSRCQPIGIAIIPTFVVIGYVTDHVLRHGFRRRWPVVLSMVAMQAFVYGGLLRPLSVAHLPYVAVSMAGTLICIAFVLTRWRLLAVAIPLFLIVFYSQRVLLLRPRTEIPVDSPLVAQLRHDTGPAGRFAVVGPSLQTLLPPNQPAMLGLRSIHTYNSLSSKHFQHYVQRLSAQGTQTYGRHFAYLDISDGLHENELLQAGVSVLLSDRHVPSDVFKSAHVINGVHILTASTAPRDSALFRDFQQASGQTLEISAESRRDEIHPETRLEDVLTYRFPGAAETRALFVSQQWHSQWCAHGEEGAVLPVVRANGIFLAVLVPPGQTAVKLEFRPWVLWSWIPQLIYGIALVLCLSLRLSRKKEHRNGNPSHGID